ncbi:serine hydrolase domain-containing protein [Deinococcus sonorensis]|uniref:Serine hydrolase domain-containing protein n=2 Tax=Deinococcus sonorensis TaxID=309891 RepID=A0AAU7UHC0_9DEIO
MDSLAARVADTLPDVTSLLVARRGQLAFERYFGIPADEPQDIQSVTKSVLSLLVGVAVERGLLRLDRPVLDGWPEAAALVQDPRWFQVTVEHLLTMTCGLPSEITDPVYDDAWWLNPDPLAFTLAQPLKAAPGTVFHYSNAGTHLLGVLLARVIGQPLETFAWEALLAPLGMPARPWAKDPQGRVWGSGMLQLTPREMLRLAQLVLQQGRWQGHRVVPSAWIQAMTRPRVSGYTFMEGLPQYGWLWWLPGPQEPDGAYATGYGGQYIGVFPHLDLAVTMTGRVQHHPPHRHIIREIASRVETEGQSS